MRNIQGPFEISSGQALILTSPKRMTYKFLLFPQVSFTARVVLICFARSANAAAGADGRSPAPILVEVRRASGDGFALLEFYTSVYRTLTRLKVVDEDHPYLDLLNTPRPDVEPSAAPSDNRFGQETKEKTM